MLLEQGGFNSLPPLRHQNIHEKGHYSEALRFASQPTNRKMGGEGLQRQPPHQPRLGAVSSPNQKQKL